jgi:hypothetical protein
MATHVDVSSPPALAARFLPALQHQLDRLVHAGQLRSRVEAALPLARGERLLALECSREGAWLAATGQALHCQAGTVRVGGVPSSWSRLDWDTIDRVTWRDRDGTLTLTRARADRTPERTVIRMQPGATLGRFAREQVAWTIVVSTTVQLDGHHGAARVVVRRTPGSDQVRWHVTVPPGAAELPGHRGAVAKTLAELRGQWGL